MTEHPHHRPSHHPGPGDGSGPARGGSNPGPNPADYDATRTSERGTHSGEQRGHAAPRRHLEATEVMPEEAPGIGDRPAGATRASAPSREQTRDGQRMTQADDDLEDLDDVTGEPSRLLMRLRDSTSVVLEADQDVQGRTVLDSTGQELGTVDDLIIDADQRKVHMLRVKSGGLLGIGATTFLLPVETITQIDEDEVRVDQTRQRVSGAPVYDPELIDEGPYYDAVYGYYGYTPYWGGALPPAR